MNEGRRKIVDPRYEEFCVADRTFFAEPGEADDGLPEFSRVAPVPESGWCSWESGAWRTLLPDAVRLPSQGWKIHVSATLDNAESVLSRVHRYCLRRRVAFRHLRNKTILLTRNAKYAPRESSGKLITIYPVGANAFAQILAELSSELEGERGPRVLSDLRYGDGPLHARYGAFPRPGTSTDAVVSKPDGTVVADLVVPTFSVPEWVEVPHCLRPYLARRTRGDEFPFRVTGSLHFSNGGGVYRAQRLTDDGDVVLKEARPYAGLDAEGTDAVSRLRREHAVLNLLAGIDGVPGAHGLFSADEHLFLAMDEVAGEPLSAWHATNYPLTRAAATERDLADYATRAHRVVDAVRSVLADIHRRGIVYADLHPDNVLVAETGDQVAVSLVDFELAFPADEPGRQALGAPGFRAPADKFGFEIDDHALASLALWLFLPVAPVLELAASRMGTLTELARRRFDLPHAALPTPSCARSATATALDAAEPDWNDVTERVADAIVASATPARTDRLFPCDIAQFRLGGSGFGYGAAGVLYALDAAGFGRYPEFEAWLLDALDRSPPRRAGFLDGAHGIAHVLAGFGYRERAMDLVDAAEPLVESLEKNGNHGFGTGLAGIGLNLLFLGRVDEAERIGSGLAGRLATASTRVSTFAGAGLSRGWSGPALLFVSLFEYSADPVWLDLAEAAIERDLGECRTAFDGSLRVSDGASRTLPFLGVGSAGIAIAIERLALHRPHARCLRLLPRLLLACHAEFSGSPGLLGGAGGLVVALAAEQRRRADPELGETITRRLAGLACYAVPFGNGGIAFPGNGLLRLSMDLSTGAAGVLLTISSTVDVRRPVFPFLGAQVGRADLVPVH
ncbi:class III lanthionine synthetase LanKC [Prauserella marina]|uniref:class III lanthionine synthetase LanKC n=1 Tax=Prauserella marina TaxID=530584 RepID=UPI0031830FE3